MRLTWPGLGKRVAALQKASAVNPAARFAGRPNAYARKVLGVRPWKVQRQIARALHRPPHKVMAPACHSVGKTWTAAWLTNYWFDSYPDSGCVITTAPTARDVRDLLWREVRLMRHRAGLGDFAGAKAPELWDSPDHYAKGFTAATGESFQGRHLRHMLFIFDEAIGIDAVFWETVKSMFDPGGRHAWLVIGNPTDTSSQMYQEELAGDWTVLRMSAPDHPNIRRQLAGRPVEYPGAVTLQQFSAWIQDWCDPIPADEATATDLQWPPGSGVWYRPGPQMESRALGRWPTAGTFGVWSDGLWGAAVARKPFDPRPGTLPEIGCDVARFGDDYTEMHVRWHGTSLHHERHNGWDTRRTTGRLVELCREYAARANALLPPQRVQFEWTEVVVKVDDGGVGGGVTDGLRELGASVRPVLAQALPLAADQYPDARSELWFTTAALARSGTLDLSRLSRLGRATLARLRQQAMAPTWKQDGSGRRVVESKADTKKRLPQQGSPDAMDAMNLAYYGGGGMAAPSGMDEPGHKRGILGR